jgi:outer membrane protein OmpA-like peptidoglycan-associated protein
MKAVLIRISIGTLYAMVALMFAAAPGSAQNNSQSNDLKARAKQFVIEGLAAQDAGRFDDAITLYNRAYELVPHPAILFNLGQAHRLKGDRVTAVGYYRKCFVVDGKSQVAKQAKVWAARLDKELSTAARAATENPLPLTSPAPPTAKVPAPAGEDQDRDGVADSQDRCSQTREDADGFQDDDGCPDPDNDGDGIIDPADRCPVDAETINGYADKDGCPDSQHPELETVRFDRGSVQLTPEIVMLLDQSFVVLQSNLRFRVEVSGHTSTDEAGALALRRAAAVKTYLVGRGLSEQRLKVLGYRDLRPLTTDKSLSARANNRRVEFTLQPLESTESTPLLRDQR